MQQTRSMTIVKVFAVTVAALILALACFGVGLGVGAMRLSPPTAAISRVENTPASPPAVERAPEVPAALPSPTAAPKATQAPAQGKQSAESSQLDVKLFNEALKLLQEQYYGDIPQGEALTYAVLRGFVAQLGDPHTSFLDPKQAAMFNSDIEGRFEGIGARVDTAEGGGVEIQYLFAEQPAEKAGLQVGDVIIAVDRKDVTKMELNDAIALIRGPRDTEVVLSIRRGDAKPFDITIVRKAIEIPTVTTKTLADGKIEYIALSEFSSVAPQRLTESLQVALQKKPAGLILDLRGNPGGLLDAAVRIGSAFVPEGNILIERSKDGKEREYARQGRYMLGKTPLAVLVDKGSASAAEIVAGAIQDAGTGKLIGDTTYGKGSVQLPNALSDGSQLRVTIAHWFTPKNRGIDGTGLDPDIAVPLTEEDANAKRDPQLDRAVEFLLTGK